MPKPSRRLVLLLAGALALGAGAFVAGDLWSFYRDQDRLPLWDMAGHGWGGVELLQALADGRPLAFLARANAQDKWPFGFSLWLLPFLTAGRQSFASATLASTVLFALVPALLVWVAAQIEASRAAAWVGLAAGALWLASPLARVHAILVMRETAGAFLVLLALGLWLRATRRDTLGAWRAAGLALLALTWTKYNYALLLVAGLALDTFVALPATRRRELAGRLARLLWPGHHPASEGAPGFGAWAWAAAIWALLGAALAGLNVGIALYALLLAAAIAILWRAGRERRAPWARWATLAPRARGLRETLALPLALWCLSPYPNHPKTILAFLRNRPGEVGTPAASTLFYYLRAFGGGFSARAELGFAVLALAGVGSALALGLAVIGRGRLPAPWRTLALGAGAGLLLASLHPYKEPRFLATVAPLLFLLAAATPSAVLATLAPDRVRTLAAHAVGIALLGAAAAPLLDRAPLADRLAADYANSSADPHFGAALGAVAAGFRAGERTALLGTFNELSASLVRWRLAQLDRRAVWVDGPDRFAPDLPLADARARLARWREEQRPQRIVVVRVPPGSPVFASLDYQRYNAWQRVALAALLDDPVWRQDKARERHVSSLRLEVLELVPAAPVP